MTSSVDAQHLALSEPETALAGALGALPGVCPSGSTIADLGRLSAGATQELWSFTRRGGGAAEKLILRRAVDRGATGPYQAGMAMEAEVMQRVSRSAVPVPTIVYLLRPEDGLGNGYVMTCVEGETLPTRIMRQDRFAGARASFARQSGTYLARIHETRVDDVPIAVWQPDRVLGNLREVYDRSGVARPVFEWAFRWLARNMPTALPPALVHGDFRNGNLMIDDDGIAAVLDWELLHLGDPFLDLGWMCCMSWRFGSIDRPVGGIGTREDFYSAYEAEAGRTVDPARVHFWEVAASLNWGAACTSMASWVADGRDASPERCAIARRASETELDLLRLLDPSGAPHAG